MLSAIFRTSVVRVLTKVAVRSITPVMDKVSAMTFPAPLTIESTKLMASLTIFCTTFETEIESITATASLIVRAMVRVALSMILIVSIRIL